MTRRRKTKIEAIKPDQQDFDAVEKEHGALRPNASKAARAERYRLAQTAKILRQLEQVVGGIGTARSIKKKRKPQK
jgi:aromatic ring hydroxylase